MVKFLKHSRLIDFIFLIVVGVTSSFFTLSPGNSSYTNPSNLFFLVVGVIAISIFLVKILSIIKLSSVLKSLTARTVYSLHAESEFTPDQLHLLDQLLANKCGDNIIDMFRVSQLRRKRVESMSYLKSCEDTGNNRARIEEDKKLISLFTIIKSPDIHAISIFIPVIVLALSLLVLSTHSLPLKVVFAAIGALLVLLLILHYGDILLNFGKVQFNMNLDSVSEEENQGYYFLLESLKKTDKFSYEYFKLYDIQNDLVKNLIRLDKVSN